MVNITANVAIIIDINANLIGLFNGTSGAVVIVNITSNSGLYIAGGLTNKGWLSASISFEAYFKSLTTISFFFGLNIGVRFTSTNVTTEVLQIIGNLLISLSAAIKVQIAGNLSLALKILIQIGTSITVQFRGSLKGLLKFAGQGLIVIYGDILWLVGVFNGLVSFFGKISGGLSYLIQKGVQFKLDVILGATNGIELLINLLLYIVVYVNLSVVLKNELNSIDNLLSLIVELGGGVSTGVTGVIKVVNGIIGVIRGSVKIEVFISWVVEFVAWKSKNGGGEIDISIYFAGLLDVVNIQNSSYSDCNDLSGFATIVSQLISGKLVVSGVNISAVIKVLTAVVSSSIQLIINILVLVQSAVTLAVSISTLFLYILQSLTTAAGSLLIQIIFPEIKIDIGISVNGNVLGTILKKFTLADVLRLLLGGINGLLKGLPIIGTIYTQISASLKIATNGSVSLEWTLLSSGASSIVKAIIDFVEGVIKAGISVPTIATTQSSGGGGGGLSWTWGFTFG